MRKHGVEFLTHLFLPLIFMNRLLNLKYQITDRTFTYLTQHSNTYAVLSYDVLSHPKTKTGSFLARRKERFKDACLIVFADAHSGIAHLNQNRWLQSLFVRSSR